MKKEIYIEASNLDEALELAKDDYFWDIIESGAYYGWPVKIYWGGTKDICLDKDCARAEREFIEEGYTEVELEDIISHWNELPKSVKETIEELIEFIGSLLRTDEEYEKMKFELKRILNKIDRTIKDK
jgi:hypothetical protein